MCYMLQKIKSYVLHETPLHESKATYMLQKMRSYMLHDTTSYVLQETRHICYTSRRRHIIIGKVVCICLRVSVNLVYKFQGKPGTTTVKHDFNSNGLKFHRGSPRVSILSWLNLKANKDYFSYEYVTWKQKSHNVVQQTHKDQKDTTKVTDIPALLTV